MFIFKSFSVTKCRFLTMIWQWSDTGAITWIYSMIINNENIVTILSWFSFTGSIIKKTILGFCRVYSVKWLHLKDSDARKSLLSSGLLSLLSLFWISALDWQWDKRKSIFRFMASTESMLTDRNFPTAPADKGSPIICVVAAPHTLPRGRLYINTFLI